MRLQAQTGQKPVNPEARKRELGRQALAAIKRAEQEVPKHITELRAQLDIFEHRYELKSERLRETMIAGRIRETQEVGEWLMTYEDWKMVTWTPGSKKSQSRDTDGTR